MLRRLAVLAALMGVAAVPAPASAGLLRGESGQVKIVSAGIATDTAGNQLVNVNGYLRCGIAGLAVLDVSLYGSKTMALAFGPSAYQCRYPGESFKWLVTTAGVGFRGGDPVTVKVNATGAVIDSDAKTLTLGWQT